MRRTPLCRRIGVELPLVLAPMGGGPGTPALAAAVSAAGGLGSIAAGYLTADALRDQIRAVRAITDRPFAVNVFAPALPPPPGSQPWPGTDAEPGVGVGTGALHQVLDRLAPVRAELGLPPVPRLPLPRLPDVAAHVEVVLAERAPVVSWTFGLLPADLVAALREAGVVLVGTATTVAEAQALAAAGADAVCAQGAEAGAHRATFLDDPVRCLVGTLALVPQVVDGVDVPVVAAGGIMDGRGMAAVLALGAQAAQLGTAFLRCPEAGTSAPHRRALAAADERSTAVTDAITGRAARGLANRLLGLLDGAPVPPYPTMHLLTADLRRAAAAQERADLMALWCGQGVRLGTERPAGALVQAIAEQADAVVAGLAAG